MLILLSQNKVAIVDEEDFDWLMQWKWYAFKKDKKGLFYAVRSTWGKDKVGRIYMHQLIMHTPKRQRN